MRSRCDEDVIGAHRRHPPFELELQRFIGLCQVQSARNASPDECAARLVDALPRPTTHAEFLVLRSVLVEFAARAMQIAGVGWSDTILPLVHLQQFEDLPGTFVRCLHAARAARSATLIGLSELRVEHAMSAITARLGDPALSAASVAATIGVSVPYLAKLLHAHCKCGFRTVLRRARLHAARTRLEQSLDRVKEVAASVGYSSTSQFDRDFRRAYDVTPGHYRRRHLIRAKSA